MRIMIQYIYRIFPNRCSGIDTVCFGVAVCLGFGMHVIDSKSQYFRRHGLPQRITKQQSRTNLPLSNLQPGSSQRLPYSQAYLPAMNKRNGSRSTKGSGSSRGDTTGRSGRAPEALSRHWTVKLPMFIQRENVPVRPEDALPSGGVFISTSDSLTRLTDTSTCRRRAPWKTEAAKEI